MGTIRKTMTPAAQQANRINSAKTNGPTSEPGKAQSSMNALKNGKYARRPDPVELLRNDHSEEEEAERDDLRAELIRRYQPPDEFAAQQAEELADLQFELLRLDRALQVILRRERELLELEQRRRALRLKQGGLTARWSEIDNGGLVNLPDSPGKFREMLNLLEWLRDGDYEAEQGQRQLQRLYGRDGAWRGVRLRWAHDAVANAASDEEREEANQELERELEQEMEQVREELALCELEQGPLSPAGEAARLLEVMSSRKWSWMRQQENLLRRSIDRKVQTLIELRRQAKLHGARAEKQAGARAGGESESPAEESTPDTAGDQAGEHNLAPASNQPALVEPPDEGDAAAGRRLLTAREGLKTWNEPTMSNEIREDVETEGGSQEREDGAV